MRWTDNIRSYTFGESQIGDPPGNAQTECDSDLIFKANYCSWRTLEVIAQGRVQISTVRTIIRRLTELVPAGHHTTPGWSSADPLILIGKPLIQNREARPTVVMRGPRVGLFASDGNLYLWSSGDLLDAFTRFSSVRTVFREKWIPWNGHYYRYADALDISQLRTVCDKHSGQANSLVEYLGFVENRLSQLPDTPSYSRLIAALESCREELGHPINCEAIYPRLTEQIDGSPLTDITESDINVDGENGCDGPSTSSAANSASHTGESTSSEISQFSRVEPIPFESTDSMLRVLRRIALERVRTALPTFGDAELDNWIMSTGYGSAPLSHQDAADLLYVYSASITNAGGAKPNFESFGGLIREAMRRYIQQYIVTTTPDNIQTLANDCMPFLDLYPLGGRFNHDIRIIAAGGHGRTLMTGLLSSVVAFCKWLRNRYGGSASSLHVDLMNRTNEGSDGRALEILRSLKELPWVGIATAANFLKDSQASGLRSLNLSPRTSAQHLASWFAKPDLHVTRLMAYITGRIAQPSFNLGKLPLGAALLLFYRLGDPSFGGNNGAILPNDGPDVRVICDIYDWANTCNTSPLEIDRLLFLTGVRRTVVNGQVIAEPWYGNFVSTVDEAIRQGIRRKS